MSRYGFSTKAIHTGEEPDYREGATGDIVPPIHLSTTFARQLVEKPTAGYEYSRSLNPSRKYLEEKLAALENAKYGLSFASGLAAESTLLFALLTRGDHVVCFDDLYGGTKRLFNEVFSNYDIEFTFVDASIPSKVEEVIKKETKLLWVETPSNPLLKLCDIQAVSAIAKRHNLILIVDNTFLSPYFQNPLDLGADIVIHSSTKYIGGHCDVVNGSVMLSNDELYDKIKHRQNAVGAIPSPFDCFLVMRGIKTLSLRMERHNYNALMISEYLEKHPKVKKVIYPGLFSHPQHTLAKTQARGFGGIISFELSGNINDAKIFLQSLQLIKIAESLGGVESLIELPAIMTHSSVSEIERKRIGISDTLIRISVGIEDIQDLIDDLEKAFEKI